MQEGGVSFLWSVQRALPLQGKGLKKIRIEACCLSKVPDLTHVEIQVKNAPMRKLKLTWWSDPGHLYLLEALQVSNPSTNGSVKLVPGEIEVFQVGHQGVEEHKWKLALDISKKKKKKKKKKICLLATDAKHNDAEMQ